MTKLRINIFGISRKNCGLSSTLTLALLGAFAGCSSDSTLEQGLVSSRQYVYATVPYRGVNLASAEFGADVWGNGTFPGSYGSTYIYPSPSEADYYIAKGMNTFRIPFRWERLQRTLNGALDATESSNLTTTVNGLTAKGAYVIIDPHNYGRYLTNNIGSTAVTNANFADFWTKLANLLKGNSKVIFAVMNEPHDMTTTEDWVTSANAGIAAIRSTGATQLILVQGYHWSGAHDWTVSSYGTANAVAMLNIVDSGHNMAFEVHQYLDSDYSGTSDQCQSTTIGSQSLQNFTDWLKAHNFKGFLSEFGGGRNATCYAAIQDEVAHIMNNSSVYLGWTYWAGGPWWGEYILTLEPTNGQDRPQMASLTPYLTPSGGTGGASSTGGAPATGGARTGGAPSTGGARTGGAPSTGGKSGTGGTKATGGSTSTGGSTGTGGAKSTGGATSVGGTKSTGGSSSSGVEPCTPSATITGGQSGNFNTSGPYCFRTPDTINGWGCSNFDGRTLQVNDVAETCGSLPMPTKYNGYYYFEASAGTFAWASIYWW